MKLPMNDTARMYEYSSILAAARGLLGEVVHILSGVSVGRFTVIGGWSALLLNDGQIRHPGTRDADILFQNGLEPGALALAVTALRDSGYLLSAKHEFQLLRVLSVSGTPFVFNVDLLHPAASETDPSLFADHVSLPIPLAEYREDTYIVKSIAVPEASFVFDGYIDEVSLDFVLPTGTGRTVTIPVINEVGAIVTKAKSMSNPKRLRDAFDVYLAIKQARDYIRVVESFRRLEDSNLPVFNTLFSIRSALDKGIPQRNVPSFLTPDPDVRIDVGSVFEDFLAEIPLPKKAKS